MSSHDNGNFVEDDWQPFDDEEPLAAKEGELTPVPWACAGCGEANETQIDLSNGYNQEYVEDCAVCCRPNLITVTIDPESLVIVLRNELEYE
jgi:hypothetical protein